jgi:hypothetical protein
LPGISHNESLHKKIRNHLGWASFGMHDIKSTIFEKVNRKLKP